MLSLKIRMRNQNQSCHFGCPALFVGDFWGFSCVSSIRQLSNNFIGNGPHYVCISTTPENIITVEGGLIFCFFYVPKFYYVCEICRIHKVAPFSKNNSFPWICFWFTVELWGLEWLKPGALIPSLWATSLRSPVFVFFFNFTICKWE